MSNRKLNRQVVWLVNFPKTVHEVSKKDGGAAAGELGAERDPGYLALSVRTLVGLLWSH